MSRHPQISGSSRSCASDHPPHAYPRKATKNKEQGSQHKATAQTSNQQSSNASTASSAKQVLEFTGERSTKSDDGYLSLRSCPGIRRFLEARAAVQVIILLMYIPGKQKNKGQGSQHKATAPTSNKQGSNASTASSAKQVLEFTGERSTKSDDGYLSLRSCPGIRRFLEARAAVQVIILLMHIPGKQPNMERDSQHKATAQTSNQQSSNASTASSAKQVLEITGERSTKSDDGYLSLRSCPGIRRLMEARAAVQVIILLMHIPGKQPNMERDSQHKATAQTANQQSSNASTASSAKQVLEFTGERSTKSDDGYLSLRSCPGIRRFLEARAAVQVIILLMHIPGKQPKTKNKAANTKPQRQRPISKAPMLQLPPLPSKSWKSPEKEALSQTTDIFLCAHVQASADFWKLAQLCK